jgi:hypothetical protein
MRVLRVMAISGGGRARHDEALDGELLRPPSLRCADPRCGCGQAWVGLASGRAAVTGVVVDLAVQREGLVAAFTDALADHGWVDIEADEHPGWVDDLVDQHLDLASSHPVGTVLHLDDQEPVAWLAEAS